MKFSQKPPTEKGFYWVLTPQGLTVVKVYPFTDAFGKTQLLADGYPITCMSSLEWAGPIQPPDQCNKPYEIIRHSTDASGEPIVDIQGMYLSNKDARKLRDELNRLL